MDLWGSMSLHRLTCCRFESETFLTWFKALNLML